MKIPRDIEPKIEKIVEYLREKGCSLVMLFGSFAEGVSHPHSDIDIAVSGISSKNFFRAIADLPPLVKHRVDLVDIDDLPAGYKKSIKQNGVILYAAA
ncbi:MAG: nucleotidyltransferase domain-containing protein [Acidobacteria bacterium]|jgi:predicted nucleotidyltransferase|nr:nucleotidyltransferase domain-containing protein [Acidobacteriota bacterium]